MTYKVPPSDPQITCLDSTSKEFIDKRLPGTQLRGLIFPWATAADSQGVTNESSWSVGEEEEERELGAAPISCLANEVESWWEEVLLRADVFQCKRAPSCEQVKRLLG